MHIYVQLLLLSLPVSQSGTSQDDTEIVRKCISQLDSANAVVRLASLTTLIDVGGGTFQPPKQVRAQRNDPDLRIRLAASIILLKSGDTTSDRDKIVSDFRAGVFSSNEEANELADYCGRLLGSDSLPGFIDAAKSKDRRTRLTGLLGIIAVMGEELQFRNVSFLTHLLNRNDDDATLSAQILGRLKGEMAPVMLSLLGDKSPVIRRNAMLVYLYRSDPFISNDAVRLIAIQLRDADDRLQTMACSVLCVLPEAVAVPIFVDALQDDNVRVRQTGAAGLERMGRRARSAKRALEFATQDSDSFVREAATNCLRIIAREASSSAP